MPIKPIPDISYHGLLAQYLPAPGALSLIRYAQMLAIPERAFFFVEDPPTDGYEFYWRGSDRRQLGEALLAAQSMIEHELGTFLQHKWVEDEQRQYGYPLSLEWGSYVCAGKLVSTIYGGGPQDVDYTTPDIGTVSVAHGGVGSEAETFVFYHDADAPTRLYRLLYPTDIDFGAANIDITFPKWRLVKPELMDSARVLNIDVDSNFVDDVLVVRLYTNTNDQVTFVGVSATTTGYMQCDMDRISKVRINAGAYSVALGAWETGAVCFVPRYLLASYKAGQAYIPYDMENAVLRLAHTLMPQPVCAAGHEPWVRFYKRDRHVPEMGQISELQKRCPFGSSDGAFYAWMVCQRSDYHIRRGGRVPF